MIFQIQTLIFKSFLGRLISTITFYITKLYIPSFLRLSIFNFLCRQLSINIIEAEKNINEFNSIDHLFTRSLKSELRPIDHSEYTLTSPVDGMVLEFGKITDDTLLQAKNINYSLSDLITNNYINLFEGSQYLTIYLSPSDCHRIFSPVNGSILSTYHISGKLIPVREPFISNFKDLYCVNDRVISIIRTQHGHVGLINVGALNVGSISIQHNPSHSEQSYIMKNNETINYNHAVPLQKGDWHSTFHLGSTVILILPKTLSFNTHIKKHIHLNYGQNIGTFKNTTND